MTEVVHGKSHAHLPLSILHAPHQENITKIFLLCIWWNSVASGRIIASPASARYFESLSPERHGRQPGDSWRHPGDTERHRETLEAVEPLSKYVPDAPHSESPYLVLFVHK